MRAECRKLLMMIGRIALSSKLPWLPANATALSSPMTWMQTITIASHWVGLTLPGHDRGAGLVLRQQQLAETAARAGGEPAHVVGDLHQRDREPAQRRHRRDHRVERALRRELVGRGDERTAGQLGDLRRDLAAEIRRRVEPGADGGAAGRELEEARLATRECAPARRGSGAPSPTIPARPSAAPRPRDASARS